jgi:hypothetical protein
MFCGIVREYNDIVKVRSIGDIEQIEEHIINVALERS